MEELLTLLEPLMIYLSPLLAWAIGLVVAIMGVIKKVDEKRKAKKWYWVIGAALSAIFALGITFIMGFNFVLFLFHFAVIYIIELGIDIGFLKPIIKELIPLLKGILSKTRKIKIDDKK